MSNHLTILASVAVGIAVGAAGVHGLKAQGKVSAYVISEIEITNQEGYVKEYVPLAQKALRESGQKVLASGGRTVSLAGEEPRQRVVVSVFEDIDKAKAAYTSSAYLEARKIGDKYGKLRIFAVEALPQ